MSVTTYTPHLQLCAMTAGDLDALWPMLSDARMWTHHPEARPTRIEQGSAYVTRAASRWQRDGLSYWTVRLRDDGEVVGSGGVQIHPRGHWNVNYRIAVARQARGYARELLAAALAAAARVDPDRPCIAWIDPDNTASRRVAERGGLVDRGLRDGAADEVPRLAFADRDLDDVRFPRA